MRKIIRINTELCNSCGECAAACREGAIGMENGKAVLLRDDYCTGLGICVAACRTGAITMEERDALPYSEKAVLAGVTSRTFKDVPAEMLKSLRAPAKPGVKPSANRPEKMEKERNSCLGQWPVKLKLTTATGAYFADAELLIAADCCAYAYGDFHRQLMRGRVTLTGCPKLDGVDYAGKITDILTQNTVRSVTIARMSLPCCGGLEQSVRRAILKSGKEFPCRMAVISPQGKLDFEEQPRPKRQKTAV